MTRTAAGVRRLRWKDVPGRRLGRCAAAAALLALAGATGDCAGRAAEPAGAPAAEVRP
ncbi:MAG TPA: hypothetical protein VFT45_14705 [Longimicrobium sp.]|nr:hypothetical protein [Longimicrobium sp.]